MACLGFCFVHIHEQFVHVNTVILYALYLSVLVCVCDVFLLQAKVDNEILDYRDLAAIPKVKAIYDIERPDLINYEPLYTTSLDEMEERESVGEVMLKSTVCVCAFVSVCFVCVCCMCVCVCAYVCVYALYY